MGSDRNQVFNFLPLSCNKRTERFYLKKSELQVKIAIVRSCILGIVFLVAIRPELVRNCIVFNSHSHKSVQILYADLAEMLIHLKSQDTLIIDFRASSVYEVSHIPTAVNVDFEKFCRDGTIYKHIAFENYKRILVYGESYRLATAHELCDKLSKQCRASIKIYSAGIEEWRACKLPLERGCE